MRSNILGLRIHQLSEFKENKVKLKLVFKALVACKFFIKRADFPVVFSLEQHDQWKSCQMQAHILYFRWLETLGLVANVELKTFPSLRRERSCTFFARPKLGSPISMDFWVFLSLKTRRNACYAAKPSPRWGTLN